MPELANPNNINALHHNSHSDISVYSNGVDLGDLFVMESTALWEDYNRYRVLSCAHSVSRNPHMAWLNLTIVLNDRVFDVRA
jgi:hypothetical protein